MARRLTVMKSSCWLCCCMISSSCCSCSLCWMRFRNARFSWARARVSAMAAWAAGVEDCKRKVRRPAPSSTASCRRSSRYCSCIIRWSSGR
ncbi:hypothetical protein V8C86DRAFT_2497205 [Haematococcus lacustris]